MTPREDSPTLNSSEERFHLLSALLPIGVFYCDAFGYFLYVNRRWQEITGSSAEDCLGDGWKSIIDTEHSERVLAEWSVRRNGPFVTEFSITTPSKDRRWVRFRSEAIRDRRGTLIGHAGTLEDITHTRQTEADLAKARDEALNAARLKAAFLANMSHEIRTPMNGVIGMSNLLLDTPLNTEQRDYAETIHSSSESLLTILNDILDLSKIEAGKLTFEVLNFNLRDLVESTLELLAVRAQSKGIELGCLLPTELPVRLCGDPSRLRQVLMNLVGNAIKFTERGEVFVSVRVAEETSCEASFRFEVRDTGIGLPPEARQRLFQAFSQADDSTARKYGGTGLGLTISKQLVHCMQGDIGLESIVGEGSTFWFTARLRKQSPAETPANAPDFANVQVLVVDDNATNRQVVQEHLKAWRMSYQSVASGSEAIAVLRSAAELGTPYHLAILDMLMPGMDGLELARAIKSSPTLVNTRLILLTSLHRRVETDVLVQAGIDDHLMKPVRQSRLFDAIARIVGSGLAQPRKPEARKRKDGCQTSPLHKPRILLADDSAVNRKVALGQLQQLQYAADAVTNGREVLAALESAEYDILLMDVEMPELNGLETTRQIRIAEREGKFPRQEPMHIIAMTARAMAEDRADCFLAGMNDYLSKPVRPDVLLAALQKWNPTGSQEILGTPSNEEPLDAASQRTPENDPGNDMTPTTTEAPVDVRRLTRVAADDPQEVRELSAFYIEQAQAMLSDLTIALQSANAPAVREIAHKFAGSSATCGMTLMTRRLRSIEAESAAGALSNVPETVAGLNVEFERTRCFLKDFLKSLPGAPLPETLEFSPS